MSLKNFIGTKKKESCIVILSGGQDSTTCLFWAKELFSEVHAITFDYGQKHAIEIESAVQVAKIAGVEHHEIIDVPNCLISMSPLTNPGASLEKYESFDKMDSTIGNRRELTFVPMRNALFLTIAANRAEALGIKNLVTGVCAMDNANYDDCRQEFISATRDYINTALGHDLRGTGEIEIHTPLMYLSKADTVRFARLFPGCWEALAYTHTSYDGKFPPTDNNHSNLLRAQGFLESGFPDPLVLRAVKDGLMELPNTENYRSIKCQEYDIRL